MAIPPLVLRIVADSKGVQQGVAKTQAQVGGMKNALVKNSALIKGALVGGVVVGLKMSVDAALEAQNAQLKLSNSLQNATGFSKGAQQAFTEQADALRDLTGVDDEAVIGAQAFLIQMKLTEDQVKSLTPLIVDLAAKMEVDLQTAAKAVGKAVNGNIGGLSRMGVIVDETKAKTDPYVATLEALGVAQGFAAKQAKNQPWKVLGAQFEELLEVVGTALLPVIRELANALKFLLPIVKQLGPVLLTAAAGLAAWWTIAKIGTLAGAISATSTAMTVFGAAALTAAGPIGVVVAGLVGLKMIMDTTDQATNRFTQQLIDLGYDAKTAADMVNQHYTKAVEDAGGKAGAAAQNTALWIKGLEDGGNAAIAAAGQSKYYADSLRDETKATRGATEGTLKYRQAKLLLAGGLLGVVAQLNTLKDAQKEVNRLEEAGKKGTEEYKDAKLVLLQEVVATKDGLIDYGAQLREEGQTYPEVRRNLIKLGQEYGLTRADVLDVLSVVKDVNAEWAKTPKKVRTEYTTIFHTTGHVPPGFDPRQRQHGGPVSMGTPYIVGEAGPELFVPNASGQILPNTQVASVGAGPVNVAVYVGEEQVRDIVVRALKKEASR